LNCTASSGFTQPVQARS